ncbi:type II toxin-antitoxin system RelE/ParE family toxin [Flavobacterium sp. LS1R47]|uniref:Type II toxin-antitoxin system RelE/ParE family toxin n=1 Tax=Flavobacterium frigoritolerans TaxID=2987686 RepID=A0A9X2ZMX1_9FLAO|nr:type II toxin-antitoxin system RelE/ParE family toxin [Flavobacterium frigoritolerans]MCV9931547.1 type II toxin-antitoxin system RelE/ParE family toxin [Flavobacterium frigoritolerans]
MREVKFTLNAEKSFDSIVNYIEKKWSLKEKISFLKKFNKSVSVIILNPESFPLTEKNKIVRKCVVTKQTTIFYVFTSKEITIVSVFDTRQNPNKIKKDIK